MAPMNGTYLHSLGSFKKARRVPRPRPVRKVSAVLDAERQVRTLERLVEDDDNEEDIVLFGTRDRQCEPDDDRVEDDWVRRPSARYEDSYE